MSKLICCVLACFLKIASAAADDTHIQIGAGGISYFSDTEDPYISLDHEVVSFDFHDASYFVNVDFDFLNNSDKTLVYDIGFPVRSYNAWKKNHFIDGAIPLDGFMTSVNGVRVEFKETERSENEEISKWYTKSVKFAPRNITKINIQYSTKYGARGGGGIWASYFYGSAYIWKGPIKTLVVSLRNLSSLQIYYAGGGEKSSPVGSSKITGPNTTRIIYDSIKPTKESTINVFLGKLADQWMWESYPTKDIKLYPDQFFFLTPSQLRIVRNLVYASNGLIFKSADLKDFYSRESWYKPQYENVDDLLNQNEKDFVSTIQELEKKRNIK